MVSLIGSGGKNELEIQLKGDASPLKRELNDAASSVLGFKETVESISAPSVDANTDPLSRKLREARAEVGLFDTMNADVEVDADTGPLTRSLATATGEVEAFKQEMDSIDFAGPILGLRGVASSADEAGDEIAQAGAKAGVTSGTFGALSVSTGALSATMSTSAVSIGAVAVSLGTLLTAALPLAGVLAAVGAGAVALGGAFAAIGGSAAVAAHQSGWLGEELKQMKNEVMGLVTSFGQQFTPLLRDAINAIPRLVQRMIQAVGSTEEFRKTLRQLGQIGMEVIPQLTAFIFDLARTALPVFMDLIGFLRTNGPAAFNMVRRSVEELWPKIQRLIDATINLLPPLYRFGTTVASLLIPRLTKFFNLLATGLQWVNSLDPAFRKVAAAGLVLAPILVKLGGFITSLIGAIGGLSGAASMATTIVSGLGTVLSALTGPIGLAIGAIALLSAAWIKDFMGIRTATMNVVNAITSVLMPTITQMKTDIKNGLRAIKKFWTRQTKKWAPIVERAMGMVKQTIRGAIQFVKNQIVTPMLKGIKQVWQRHGKELQQEFQETWNSIKQRLVAVWNFIQPYIRKAMSLMRQSVMNGLNRIRMFWNKWGDEIMTVMSFVADSIVGTARFLVDALLTTISVGLDLIQGDWEEAWTKIKSFLTRTLDGIVSFAKKWGGQFISWLSGVLQDALNQFIQWGQDLIFGSVVKDIFNAVLSFLKDIWNRISTFFTDTLNSITQTIRTKFTEAQTTINNIVSGIQTFLQDTWNAIDSFISDTMSAIETTFSNVWSSIDTTITNIVNGIESFISETWNGIQTTITNVMESIESTINDILGTIETVWNNTLGRISSDTDTEMSNAESYFSGALDGMESTANEVLGAIEDAFSSTFDTISDIADDIISEAQSAADQASDALSDAQDWADDAQDAASNAVDWADDAADAVTGGGGGDDDDDSSSSAPSIPDRYGPSSGSIPGLASGGIVTGPTQAIIGEGGEHEAVIPLPDLQSMAQEAGTAGARRAGGESKGGDTHIHIDSIEASSYRGGQAAARGFKDELRSNNFD